MKNAIPAASGVLLTHLRSDERSYGKEVSSEKEMCAVRKRLRPLSPLRIPRDFCVFFKGRTLRFLRPWQIARVFLTFRDAAEPRYMRPLGKTGGRWRLWL
jgi:hypothetical protein